MVALVDHAWPGNVRQLQNELQRAAILAGDVIDLGDLSPELQPRFVAPSPRGLHQTVEQYEARLIEAALQRCDRNVSRAARELQVHRVLLYKKMRRHGILPARAGSGG